MSETDETQIPPEPHDGIDAAAGKEAQAYEQNQSSPIARASGEGPPPTDAPEAGTVPEVHGTGAGDPLAGAKLEDGVETVAGDEGPEHPGVRRSS